MKQLAVIILIFFGISNGHLYSQTPIGNLNGFKLGMSVQEVLTRVKEIKPSFINFDKGTDDDNTFDTNDKGDTINISILKADNANFYGAELWMFDFLDNRCYFIATTISREDRDKYITEIEGILTSKYGKSKPYNSCIGNSRSMKSVGKQWLINDKKDNNQYQIRLYRIIGQDDYSYSLDYINKKINDKIEKEEEIKIKKAIKDKLKSKKLKF